MVAVGPRITGRTAHMLFVFLAALYSLITLAVGSTQDESAGGPYSASAFDFVSIPRGPVGDWSQLRSHVKCQGSSWVTRNCTLTDVVLWQDTIYIIVDDPASAEERHMVPAVNLHPHHTMVGHLNFTEFSYTTPSSLLSLLTSPAANPLPPPNSTATTSTEADKTSTPSESASPPSAPSRSLLAPDSPEATSSEPDDSSAAAPTTIHKVAAAVFWYMWGNNFWHTINERITNPATRLCDQLGICDHSQEALRDTLMIFKGGDYGEASAAAREQLHCITAHHPVILHNATLPKPPPVLIHKLLVGMGEVMFASQRGGMQEPPRVLFDYWRRRLLTCMGFPGEEMDKHAAEIQPPMVTMIQRRSNSRRSFLNLPEVVLDTQRALPGVQVQVVMLEGMNSSEVARLYLSTTVLLQFHGAAMVHMVFLPKGAVFVDVNPPIWRTWEKHFLPAMIVRNFQVANNLTLLPYDLQHPLDAVVAPARIQGDREWSTLPAETQVRVLAGGECAGEGLDGEKHMQLRKRCENMWLARDLLGVLLDPQKVVELLQEGLRAVEAGRPSAEQAP